MFLFPVRTLTQTHRAALGVGGGCQAAHGEGLFICLFVETQSMDPCNKGMFSPDIHLNQKFRESLFTR